MTENPGKADRLSLRRFVGAERQHLIVEIEAGLLSDIERRMGIEDLQTGKQQEEQRDRPEPMRDAGPQMLSVHEPSAFSTVVHRIRHLTGSFHASRAPISNSSRLSFLPVTTRLRDRPASGNIPEVV